MHFVYVVGTGSRWKNNELRYSLRSLCAHVGQDFDVTVVGHAPPWLAGVRHVPAQDVSGNPVVNTTYKVAAALPELPDSFIFMNDDFYVMKPLECIPIVHSDLMAARLTKLRLYHGIYIQTFRKTYVTLRALGIKNPLSFDCHIPFPMERAKLEALPSSWWCGELRLKSLYGNLHYHGLSIQGQDVKAGHWNGSAFWSTPAIVPPAAAKILASRFPEKCRYEH